MLSGSCGTRDEPYVPRRRADASVLKRGLSWGHLLNIYKLKATSCGLFASGNRVRSPMSGMGCSFRLRPRWETPSHSDRKFRVAFSARALNWKLHPTPKANSWTHFPKPHPFGKCVPLCIHPANACECVVQDGLVIGVMENVTPNACHGAVSCQEKSLENLEAFTFVRLNARHRERRSTRPKRPFWRLQPCYPDLPWWDGPSRQPSCRAAS